MKHYDFLLKLEESYELSWKTIPDVIKQITGLFNKQGIDFCIIGGTAVATHGYVRTTDDIDLLVDVKDKEKFNSLMGTYFSPRFTGAQKKVFWNDPQVKVDVIFSGEKAGNERGIEFPTPKEVDEVINGIPIITLQNLIKFKLTSGLYGQDRLQDFADVQRLVLANKLSRDFANEFPDELETKYLQLWTDKYGEC